MNSLYFSLVIMQNQTLGLSLRLQLATMTSLTVEWKFDSNFSCSNQSKLTISYTKLRSCLDRYSASKNSSTFDIYCKKEQTLNVSRIIEDDTTSFTVNGLLPNGTYKLEVNIESLVCKEKVSNGSIILDTLSIGKYKRML